ncbi:MAG: short chain dehydrogenase [Rhodobacterales bacterium]|nr:MAG: short chain dehydrogenase [Rhodobacterales bacterium]
MSRVALVTGGATRLGRAMALCLAREGFDVAVHFNQSDSAAKEVGAEIEALGQRAALVQADLLDESQTETIVPRVMETLGAPVVCLVNNASIFEYDRMGSLTRESWDRHMESNLRAPVVLTQAVAEHMPQAAPDETGEPRAPGLVVNMVDQRVRKLTPEFMSYTIAKMGLWAFTQTAARALAPHVRVNAIGPGPTMIGHRQTPEHFAAQRAATILERGANPEDVTGALRYFLSSPAVTGQLLCVDGGQHLGWQTPDVQTKE